MNFPLRVLGLTFLKILCLRLVIWAKNSGLSFSSERFQRDQRSFSSSVGLTIVQQSRSLKKFRIRRLMRFFFSTLSEVPFYSLNALSRYSLEFIALPYQSKSFNAKSLTTHMNYGKYLATSSGSASSAFCFFIYNYFDRLMIKDKFQSAFSSIVPIELYTK